MLMDRAMFSHTDSEDNIGGWVFRTPSMDDSVPRQNAAAETSPLRRSERLALLDVIDGLAEARSLSDIARCADEALQRILPHGAVAGGIASLEGNEIKPHQILTHRFPRSYLESLRRPDGSIDSPIFRRWQLSRSPIFVNAADSADRWPEDWLANIAAHGLRNLAVHGFADEDASNISFFCFARIPEIMPERHAYVLRRLAPHLHRALARCLTGRTQQDVRMSAPKIDLTPRQMEVLKWLHLGKTNWEIARIMSTSESNIKYHITRIFAALGAGSRTQAVAKALSMRLIDL
jgi:transcriptional regulator EpsA